MPRIDDYKQALKLASEKLSDKNPDLVASLSGAEIGRDKEGRTRLSLNSLNQKVSITWPDFVFGSEKAAKTVSEVSEVSKVF